MTLAHKRVSIWWYTSLYNFVLSYESFYTFYSYVSYHFEPDMEVTYVLEIRHDPSG